MTVTSEYGTNIAFIEELHEKYRRDPNSVSESWRDFFQGYEEPDVPAQPNAETAAPAQPDAETGGRGDAETIVAPFPASPRPRVAASEESRPRVAAPEETRTRVPAEGELIVPLRGVASKIVQNMEASLEVPTATSVRVVPVKALEENRRIINNHLGLMGQSKASYTHAIAWAIIKAIRDYPRMNSSFRQADGQPVRIDRQHVNLGIAIDVEKKDGSRSLLVPNIKNAQAMDFAQFLKAYNDTVRKARSGALELADFEGTTISLTNPGTIGTVSSVPRLMPQQGTIIATGQIDFPAEYSATDPEVVAELGISKVMTITSTYDHRIIQGAESGAFLGRIHELLIGADDFYDEIFRDLRIPYEPARWAQDKRGSLFLAPSRDDIVNREAAVLQLINAYRVRGHLLADLDPLEYHVRRHPELNPAYYGFTIWDFDRDFITGGLSGKSRAELREILDILRDTYCGKIGPEYMFIQDPVQKKWLQDRMEPTRNSWPLDKELQRRILRKLNDAEAFEKFLHTKYIGHKRFSLEGAESLIPILDHLLNRAADAGVEEVVIGMAHRGRLNVLANILGKSYETLFLEFEGDIDPNSTQGSGDVKYHLGADGVHESPGGKKVELELASNPSHLEAVDPIVEGMARAKQKLRNDYEHARVVPLLLHGDAAFAGQGVVAETLNLSQLTGYKTGGTVHVVINNQIGFTTGPEEARSSVYATDIAKIVQAPIFHVNGDDPEACVRAVEIAFDFRQKFKKDVVIDMVCYRRWGHNEGDDPSLTQPRMYKLIKDHRTVRKIYTETLLRRGDINPEEAESSLKAFRDRLEEAFDRTRESEEPPLSRDPLYTDEEHTGHQNEQSPDTGVPRDQLAVVGRAITTVPDSFTVHPKLKGYLEKRRAMAEGREPMDWATAEMLAFGTLLLDGFRVRLSGQDSGRGTFSQRHAIIVDHNTGQEWVALNVLARNHPPSKDLNKPEHAQVHNVLMLSNDDASRAPINFSVYDSLLSEYGVLGFEYGYSVADPGALVAWEAQFGDFMNGAQIVIDQFIASAEEKWGQHSGLTLLLPHGYEGQGPEHSSARLERFLTLGAEGNMQVVYPTTPAQYFHVLRRQMRYDPRKPLVVMTPKSLLRHPQAVSSLDQLTSGRFEPVLDDPSAAGEAGRVILTSGKIAYDLFAARGERKDVAILRLEQFYPWPEALLRGVLERYASASELVWVQEEPHNMGGWRFVEERLRDLTRLPLRYVGRPIAASPATGSHRRHEQQQQAIVSQALG